MTEMTIGEQLKQAREKKHLTLDAVAEVLHIRPSYLQNLEDNNIDELPSKTQARGFIRMYASHLGLDPRELLAILEPAPEIPPVIEPELKKPKASKTQNVFIGLIKKKPPIPENPAPISEPLAPSNEPTPEAYDKVLKQISEELIARRKKLGLSLDEVEKHTHIRKTYLDAIETGRIDNLPSTIQGRGLLSNYAEFLDLDPDPLLVRFAEALQNRLNPGQEAGGVETRPAEEKRNRFWFGVKKYLTLDMIFGGALILTLFFFVFWGAAQLINSNTKQTGVITSPVSGLFDQTPSPAVTVSISAPTEFAVGLTPSPVTGQITATGPSPSPAAPQNAFGSGSLQVNAVATQSAFLRVIADGKQIFNDRVFTGNAYQFSGSKTIELITGNAAALQITFNATSLGTLGSMGQVVDLIFTSAGAQTATPIFTPTATPTPTNTPTPTLQPSTTVVQPTITPLVPNP